MDHKIEIEIREAKSRDLLISDGLLKIGQIIYIKSLESKKINGPFIIDRFVRPDMVEYYFKKSLIYVPKIEIDNDIHHVLQSQFKKAVIKRELTEV